MSELVTAIMDSIRSYGPWSVFVGVIIESVIVPIPSPLIIMGAGFILIRPDLGVTEALPPILRDIVLPGSIASTLGAYIGYAIGYAGGKPLVERYKGFLGFEWEDIEAMERRFRAGHINATIFFLRALPVFPLSVISAAAGLLRLPLGRFGIWTFAGAIPRCLLLAYLGWWVGETYHQAAESIDRLETIVSAALILATVAFIVWLRFRVRSRILGRQDRAG
jgi:membrane protein DedA with SNARE-associated domain